MADEDAGKGAQDARDAEELRQAARGESAAPKRENAQRTENASSNASPDAEKGPVPYDRFKQTRDELAARDARIAELEAAEQRRQRAAMTEADRTKAERDEAAQKAAAAEERAARAERENVLYRAAVKLGFADPDDAAVYLGSDASVTDADSAAEKLEELLERKPHLAAGESASRPRSIGAPRRDREPEGDGRGDRPTRRLGATDEEAERERLDAELGRDIGQGLGFLRRGSGRA